MKKLLVLLSVMLCLVCFLAPAMAEEDAHPGLLTISGGQSIGDGSYINHNDAGYPFIATFDLGEDTIPLKSCVLGVYSWDCDEDATGYSSTDEYDMVFVNGTFVGVVSGVNNSWKTTYFSVPIEALHVGSNNITIYVGHREHGTGNIVQNTDNWLLEVKWLSLQIDDGQAPEAPERFEISLTTANRTASGISCSANVEIESDKQRSYVVEYSLVDKTGVGPTNGQIIAGDEENVAGTNIVSTGYFFLPSSSPMGNYEIQATLRDPASNEILAHTSKTFDMQSAIDGGCDHVGTTEKKFVQTELQRLGKNDPEYDQMHRAIDEYTNICSKCNKTFYIYENVRNEAHTLPSCDCGYVDPNHNAIRSASLSAVANSCAGEPFVVTVVTDSNVLSLSATNNTGYPISDEWDRMDHGDGTVTWTRIYTANLVSKNQYWDVTAYSSTGAKMGTMRTNSIEIKEADTVSVEEIVDSITASGQYTLKVMDGETGAPVPGAKVVLMGQAGTTDANGAVVFERKQFNGSKGLLIQVDEYHEHKDPDYSLGISQSVDVIAVYKAGTVKVVPLMCNEDNIGSGMAQLNTKAPLEAKITVSGKVAANDEIVDYKLYMDDAELATSTNGVFKVDNGKFTKGAKLKVVMTVNTAGGKTVTAETPLNIVVVSEGLGNWFNLDGIPILEGMDLGIEGLPEMLGNFKLEFVHKKASSKQGSLKSSYGFDDLVIDNYKITGGFGVTVDKDFVKINKALRKLNEKNGWSKDKSASFNPAFAVQFSFNDQGIYQTTASLGANGSASIGKSHTHIVPIGPFTIPFNIKWNIGGGVGLFASDIGYNWNDKQWVTPDATLSLSGEVGGSVGVGCDFANAGFYGKLNLNASGTASISAPVKVSATGQIAGEVGLKAEVDLGPFVKWEGKLPLWEPKSEPFRVGHRVYNVYLARTTEQQNAMMQSIRSGRYMAANNVVSDVGYTSGQNGAGYTVLEKEAAALSEIQLGQAGDQKIAVYVQNDGQGQASYGHLVYRVEENGEWSEPRALSGSGLLEGDFSLAGDGENLYIAYVQMKRSMDEVMQAINAASDLDALIAAAKETLAPCEIVVARYDGAQKAFVEATALTNDEFCDYMPSLTIVDGKPQVAWIKDPSNSIFNDAGMNELHLAVLGQSGEWEQQKLAEGLPIVARMQVGQLSGAVYAAVVTDENNHVESTADRRLTLYGREQNPAVLAEGEVDMPAFAAVQGASALLWYQDGKIMSVNEPAGTPAMLYDENYAIPAEFITVQDQNRSYLLYTIYEQETETVSRNVVGVDLNDVSAYPVMMTELPGYIDAFDAVLEEDGVSFVLVHTNAVFGQTDFETTSDLCALKYLYSAAAELVALDWSTLDFAPGEDAELYAYVMNIGTEPITELQVSMTGACEYAGAVQVEIAPGSIGEVLLTCTLPETLAGAIDVKVALTAEELEAMEAVKVSLEFVDYAVDARQMILAGQHYLLFTVQNNGSVAGSCTMNVRENDAQGQILATQEITLEAGTSLNDMILLSDKIAFADGEASKIIYVELIAPTEDEEALNNEKFVTFHPIAGL